MAKSKPHEVKNRTLAAVRTPMFKTRRVPAKKGKGAVYKRHSKHKNNYDKSGASYFFSFFM